MSFSKINWCHRFYKITFLYFGIKMVSLSKTLAHWVSFHSFFSTTHSEVCERLSQRVQPVWDHHCWCITWHNTFCFANQNLKNCQNIQRLDMRRNKYKHWWFFVKMEGMLGFGVAILYVTISVLFHYITISAKKLLYCWWSLLWKVSKLAFLGELSL